MTKEINLRDVARKYYDGGLNVLPATSKKKCPLGKWKEFIQARPAFDVAFPAGIQFDALFVVCGTTSGGLTVLDFDQSGLKYDDWRALNDLDLIAVLPNETTQHDGRHVAFRSENCGKGEKLASNAAGVTIETRGEGQGVIVAPSADYAMNWGNWANVPAISDDQRRRLIETARSLDESPKKPATSKKNATKTTTTTTKATPFPPFPAGQSVADALRADLGHVKAALTRNGWQFLRLDGDYEQWQRPGQEVEGKPGGSLCVNLNSELYGNFHCFTSNAAPLEIGKNYSPLRLIAALEHGGDESSAAQTYSQHAPRKGQIVELINFEEQRYAEMAMNASGVEYSELDDPRAACYARQFKRLEEEAGKRARRSLEDIDVERLNESFPLEEFKEYFGPVATLAENLAKKHKTPLVVNTMVGLWALSGVSGYDKLEYYFNNKRINPLIHVNLRSEKGQGKTTSIGAFTNPIVDNIDIPNADTWEKLEGEKIILEAQIERAKSDQKAGKPVNKEDIKNWQDRLRLIEWKGKTIVISQETSFEAVQYEAYIAKIEARINNEPLNGRLFLVDDDTYWMDVGRNFRNENELVARLARATQVLDVTERPSKKVTDKARGGARAACAWILSGQLKLSTMIQSERCLAQGFDRRFLYGIIPNREYSVEIDDTDIKPIQDLWLNLVFKLLEYAGGKFQCGYMDAYKKWRPKLANAINTAERSGDGELKAFLTTLLENTVHAITLHGHITEALNKGQTPAQKIGDRPFVLATKLIDPFINIRNVTWRQMKLATSKGDAAPSIGSTNPLDNLTPAARSVYEYVRANGEPFDKSDRAATITDIVDKGKQSAYRTRKKIGSGSTERERIDAELNEAGLMYVHRETGKRVALPVYTLDDFWKDDDQQQETIDAATTNEVSSERSDVEP